ncbi:hypothetical protein HanHA300_Chr09g0329841 [Helianthus annuus]|uniref:Uncharacterized protein n=1 Tax=Helianthus annuus TaxID=4232 RepID=A0A251TX31_HELAN|nr:hypothetical protein HanHA300_Chr09g0329841 [Helianthus annuus]KAJ0543447.1 hypothetical protein HanHA89_Chr09g0350781 [Helianthus annuus]KAJ0708490.1 hypothetical protein HanLR1_Chr09g0329971 [Helianthus annuus]
MIIETGWERLKETDESHRHLLKHHSTFPFPLPVQKSSSCSFTHIISRFAGVF